jgi:phosphoenolpyruvate carboxykinase (GTP)
VLKWIAGRIDGTAEAVETPIGFVPAAGAMDLDGLDLPTEAVEKALEVDVEEWKAELPLIEEWLDRVGDKVPAVLWAELDALRTRLG